MVKKIPKNLIIDEQNVIFLDKYGSIKYYFDDDDWNR